jgi:hypothetical protein
VEVAGKDPGSSAICIISGYVAGSLLAYKRLSLPCGPRGRSVRQIFMEVSNIKKDGSLLISIVRNTHCVQKHLLRTIPEAEFLDVIETKVLRVFLLAVGY